MRGGFHPHLAWEGRDLRSPSLNRVENQYNRVCTYTSETSPFVDLEIRRLPRGVVVDVQFSLRNHVGASGSKLRLKKGKGDRS